MTPIQTPPPQTPPRPMTAEEFGEKHSGDRVEYVNGRVQEMPMPGGKHGKAGILVSHYITAHVLAHDLGHVFGLDTFVRVPTRDDPQRVYGADMMLVPYDRLPRDAEIPSGVVTGPPLLVVEVKSPSDTWTGLFEKAEDYFGAGVSVVVLLDPERRAGAVHRPGAAQEPFGPGDTLTLPDVLPGFAVPVADLFR